MPHDEHRDWHEMNRRSWNAVTPAHNSHKSDQAGFLRNGGSTLFPEEVELCGPLEGARVVHLQCNCGQDTLSLAQLGATVTGIDIADSAIDFARQLSADAGLDATFHRADLLEFFAREEHHGEFDIAFATYGTIAWLADLPAWARGVHSLLAPGGRLVLLEFHPVVWCFDGEGRLKEPYFDPEPIHESDGVQDYVARSGSGLSPMGYAEGISGFENPVPAVSFQWTVASLVQSVIDAGLVVETLREYPFANGCAVIDGMRETAGRRFRMPPGLPDMPLMLGLTARKPGRE